jgi:hypothetical protein
MTWRGIIGRKLWRYGVVLVYIALGGCRDD